MITPPKKVRKPFALCEALCDFKERPICTIPKPSRIKSIALIAEKIKSERLLIVANGLAVKTVFVISESISTADTSTIFAFFKNPIDKMPKMCYYNYAKLIKYIKISFLDLFGGIIPFFVHPNFEFDKNANSNY